MKWLYREDFAFPRLTWQPFPANTHVDIVCENGHTETGFTQDFCWRFGENNGFNIIKTRKVIK